MSDSQNASDSADEFVDVSDQLNTPVAAGADGEAPAFDDGFVEDDENLAEDIAIVVGDDDPAPVEVDGFDIDITEGDGPLLEGGDDVDTGSAGGMRAGL